MKIKTGVPIEAETRCSVPYGIKNLFTVRKIIRLHTHAPTHAPTHAFMKIYNLADFRKSSNVWLFVYFLIPVMGTE